MDFSDALLALKNGKRLQRTGWDGKDQFVFWVPESRFKVSRPPLLGIYPEVTYPSHIDIKSAQGVVMPWQPSQADICARDWEVVSGDAEDGRAPELPKYKCHKTVRAAMITDVGAVSFDADTFVISLSTGGEVAVTREWKERHNPVAGGYFVVYEDGYTSFSPGPAFEAGYTLAQQ